MTHPANTAILSDEKILDLYREVMCSHADGRGLQLAIVAFARAVIEKLGASDAVPVATATWHWFDDEHGVWSVFGQPTRKGSPGEEIPLYDATALAAARQQGRNEGREEARAELGPDAERYRWLKEQRDDQVWNHAMSEDEKERAETLDAAIDAARQPTQKET